MVWQRFLWALFILCLPLLLFTGVVSVAVNLPQLYHYGFHKYGVAGTTGLTISELERVAGGLIGYFNSGEESIDLVVEKDGRPLRLFNEREVAHLRDVKALFHLAYRCALGALGYFLLFLVLCLFVWRRRRLLASGLFWGGCLTLVLVFSLGLIAATDFDSFFLRFHLISFSNDLWMLDPTRDYLIMLFPQGFWFDSALFCFGAAALLAMVLGGIGYWQMHGPSRS
ncbi:MAG: TIGR01906 family membrane protein [Dehalococcoidales bacterium]|nr:TIGR01906 family membrane protein [Dehalococcoidales bacterium]